KSVASVVLSLIFVAIVQGLAYTDVLETEWSSFRSKHEKLYEDQNEALRRKQIFKQNKELIDTHNKRFADGKESFEMGVNQFTDLSAKEFEEIMLSNLDTPLMQSYNTYTPPENVTLPSSFDWREKKAVTPVKFQGHCGSCWAFAAVGALESYQYIKTGQLMELSEQNLIDCTRKYGNRGCHGGRPRFALKYVQDNGGLESESAYPYEVRDDAQCRFYENAMSVRVLNFTMVAPTEAALAEVVANIGPVAAAVDAGNFQLYKGGVYYDPNCRRNPNHAVLVVGYGHDENHGDYWLVKNSWSTHWGEDGYIRMARNRNNNCQIAAQTVYPVV
ncbi:CG11459, partial [Drosophila busckii]